jgi:hypothetical protein
MRPLVAVFDANERDPAENRLRASKQIDVGASFEDFVNDELHHPKKKGTGHENYVSEQGA